MVLLLTVDIMCVSGKTRVANGGVRSNSPSCTSSSMQMLSKRGATVASGLVATAATSLHPSAVTAVRKSACLGGQSLATSAAKRLLARPTCRGGRMMPEPSAKHRAAMKKSKPKRVASKPATDENSASGKCPSELRLQSHQPASASASQCATTPEVATVSEKPKNTETVAAPLPRIVIKIHLGRIVSPSTVISSSASSVSRTKHRTEQRSGNTKNSHESRSSARTQQTEKSHRLKTASKSSQDVAVSKSHAKISSQSSPAKVLAEKNSNIAYFDSSQLQSSGSYDKLSLDCCMKLYNQLRDQQTAGQPTPSSLSENSKSSKHASSVKSRHKSSNRRILRASEAKKCLFDELKKKSSAVESLPTIHPVGSSKLSSRSQTLDCTVELNRIKPDNGSRAPLADPSTSSVEEKSNCDRERYLDADSTCDTNNAAVIDDDCCSVTLTPRPHSILRASADTPSIPTATDVVPGSSVLLSKIPRCFSKRSHTLTEAEFSTSSSPKRSRSGEIAGHADSLQKWKSSVLSSPSNRSANNQCTAIAADGRVLSGCIATHLLTKASCITDSDKLCTDFEVPSAAAGGAEIKNSNACNAKNAACDSSADVPVSATDCSSLDASDDQKHCKSVDNYNSSTSHTVCKPGSVKKPRLSYPVGETSSHSSDELMVSDSISELHDGASSLYHSLSAATNSNTASSLSENISVPELSSVYDSPSHLPNTQSTVDSSSVPLRLKIRRLPDVSPVVEVYNVVGGHDAETDPTSITPCSMCHL